VQGLHARKFPCLHRLFVFTPYVSILHADMLVELLLAGADRQRERIAAVVPQRTPRSHTSSHHETWTQVVWQLMETLTARLLADGATAAAGTSSKVAKRVRVSVASTPAIAARHSTVTTAELFVALLLRVHGECHQRCEQLVLGLGVWVSELRPPAVPTSPSPSPPPQQHTEPPGAAPALLQIIASVCSKLADATLAGMLLLHVRWLLLLPALEQRTSAAGATPAATRKMVLDLAACAAGAGDGVLRRGVVTCLVQGELCADPSP
jgi:hypothetical protein